MYLCCDTCRSCCYISGVALVALQADPPVCAGCGAPMDLDDRPHPLPRAS